MIDSYLDEDFIKYIQYLKIFGSLSNLFSESKIPYIQYRIVENLYCKTFKAFNYSRSDLSVDAKFNSTGIGLNTFIRKGASQFEKIA